MAGNSVSATGSHNYIPVDEERGGSASPMPPVASIDSRSHRFPTCIVWTPIPLISWLCPIIGHMGIARSDGVIRDFGGPYYVAEDDMTFGWPTKYWSLNPEKATGGVRGWDEAVEKASQEYRGRCHNLFCDNCHSHVSMALNEMQYNGRTNWNMVLICLLFAYHSRYVSCGGFLKQWLPFSLLIVIIVLLVIYLH